MPNPWYDVVDSDVALTQGDLLFRCPLLSWNPAAVLANATIPDAVALRQSIQTFDADVVVMTQACDLEHDKVGNVVLCPHVSISEFRISWDQSMLRSGQNPTSRAWKNACDDIAEGHIWNQAYLNRSAIDSFPMELRVVEFQNIFTVPRPFLNLLLANRKMPRLRLLAPYREHLSQAFARFFMRVGLPQPLDKTW